MPHLKVDGRMYEWPEPSSIKFKEARMIRQYLDASVMNIISELQQGRADENTLLAMFLIAKQRTDGNFNFDEVMNLTIEDIEFVADQVKEDEESPLAVELSANAEPQPAETPSA